MVSLESGQGTFLIHRIFFEFETIAVLTSRFRQRFLSGDGSTPLLG